MAKELGLSKSGMISVALENYKKGQVKIKKPSWQAGLLNVLCLDIVYFMAKEKARFLLFCCIRWGRFPFRLGNKTGVNWSADCN